MEKVATELGGQRSMMVESFDLPGGRIGAANWTRQKGEFMYFNHGEFRAEQEEQEEQEIAGDLEGIVVELEEVWILESEPFIEPTPEYVPKDD